MKKSVLLLILFFLGCSTTLRTPSYDGGSTNTPPNGGSTNTPPDGGSTNTPPDGGGTNIPPDGGSTNTPPDGGGTNTPPDGGGTNTPPPTPSTKEAFLNAVKGPYAVNQPGEEFFKNNRLISPTVIVTNKTLFTIAADGTFTIGTVNGGLYFTFEEETPLDTEAYYKLTYNGNTRYLRVKKGTKKIYFTGAKSTLLDAKLENGEHPVADKK